MTEEEARDRKVFERIVGELGFNPFDKIVIDGELVPHFENLVLLSPGDARLVQMALLANPDMEMRERWPDAEFRNLSAVEIADLVFWFIRERNARLIEIWPLGEAELDIFGRAMMSK